MTHVWFWRKRLGERKGHACHILARSRAVAGVDRASILVEFDDGHRVVTSVHAVRRARHNSCQPQPGAPGPLSSEAGKRTRTVCLPRNEPYRGSNYR